MTSTILGCGEQKSRVGVPESAFLQTRPNHEKATPS
jgi:hypothetical protein